MTAHKRIRIVKPIDNAAHTEERTLDIVKINHGDKLEIHGSRRGAMNATAFTIAGDAKQRGECPVAAEEKCRANMVKFPGMGHVLRAISLDPIVLADHYQDAPDRIVLAVGDVIDFEGCFCRIETRANNNFEPVPLNA